MATVLRDVVVTLQPEEEWRFEVDYGAKVEVVLAQGRAEIFGTELAPSKKYTFSGAKLAAFTWHGCVLQVGGAFTHQYTASQETMTSILQLHDELEQRRQHSLASLQPGPVVMVVGASDAGKSTTCRILANYAARRGHGPLFLDVDPAQPTTGVPGTLSATAWTIPWDVESQGDYNAPVSIPVAPGSDASLSRLARPFGFPLRVSAHGNSSRIGWGPSA